MEEITEARRKAVEATIRAINIVELKALGERLFPFIEDPWRGLFFDFVNENIEATFHYAVTQDGVHFIYCHAMEKGMWFLPKVGRGPMQPKGLAIFKQIVEGR